MSTFTRIGNRQVEFLVKLKRLKTYLKIKVKYPFFTEVQKDRKKSNELKFIQGYA